jgi:predicted TIM-barrel fold metal-dependent hydrolase
MLFDFRVFLGKAFNGLEQSVQELLGRMDALDIEMALACPLKPLAYDLDAANAELGASIENHRDRLVGASRIDPWQRDAPASLLRALDDYGLSALYLNPWEENFRADLEMLDPLIEVAGLRGVPVLVATGYPWRSEALQVVKLALRSPSVPIVMTNGGQINITGLGQADATLAMQQAPNLYIDTAGVYRQDFIEETVEEFGGERVLYGSGSPYFDQRYEIKRISFAKVDASTRSLMESGNAKRLLGLA